MRTSKRSFLLGAPLLGALVIGLIGCGTAVESRDDPLQLSPSAISVTAPMGLPFGKDKDAIDDAASNEWGIRPNSCTSGRMNTTNVIQQEDITGRRITLNPCSYIESECDDLPTEDPRVKVLRCDYPNSLNGGDGRELVLTFLDGKLGAVGIYDSFIDEPTARTSGNLLVTTINGFIPVPAELTKPERRIVDPRERGEEGTIHQRISWNAPAAEVRVELIEMSGHIWAVGYTTIARDLAVWIAGTDPAGKPVGGGDGGEVVISGAGALGGVTASPRQLELALEELNKVSDQMGLCLPLSDRPPPENWNATSISY